MKRLGAWTACLLFVLFALGGCVTTAGAIVGGAAGQKIGGDTASTVGGAVLGGIIGHEIAK